MALSLGKEALKIAIKNAMDAAMTASQNKDADSDLIRTQFATSLADAMEDFVKTIQITIGSSQINVTGSSGPSTNPLPIIISNAPPDSID
jgi:hypothetical protein